MKKLVVSDFDGTLLPYGQKTVSKKIISYINKLISDDVSFAVASGRTYSELKALLNGIVGKIYYICDDGAVTVYDDKGIFRKPFSRVSLKAFFDDSVFKNAVLYSLDKAYFLGDKCNFPTFGKSPQKISKHFEIDCEVYKVSATVKSFELVNTNLYRVHYAEGYFAEFVTPYANKGVAVADLQLKLGISKFDTFVIGDAGNDVPMVQHASRSWAVGDKSPELKLKSKNAVSTADEALEDIINILK